MGLLKAGTGAIGSTLADQWKEYFYCDAMDVDTLVIKGQKRISSRSSNTKGSDNIISNGSGIAVADGQCMLIVEQGQIVEVCAEPGKYTYDQSSEPSIFAGSLGSSIKETFKLIGKRFTFGGDTANDQRVYYINTKEIMDNKFGTANPFLFHVGDEHTGLQREVSIRCNGIYSYKISDPLKFYKNVCGNVEQSYEREQIDTQLKTEFISALQPAFGKLSGMQLLPSEIPAHAMELEDAMNETLTKRWYETRGIQIVSIAMNPITLLEEDLRAIQKIQERKLLRDDPNWAAATMVEAQAEAMKSAAGNPNSSMMGFMGMGMASQAGGMNANQLYVQGEELRKQVKEESWTCSCGTKNTSKFCTNCGKPKENGWVCSCGALNKGKFCMECGKPKPAEEPLYRCDKCGWEPADPKNPPKFCPECGDPFDDHDIK